MSPLGREHSIEHDDIRDYRAIFEKSLFKLNSALKAFDYKEEGVSDEELNKNLLTQRVNTIKVLQQIISDIEKKM